MGGPRACPRGGGRRRAYLGFEPAGAGAGVHEGCERLRHKFFSIIIIVLMFRLMRAMGRRALHTLYRNANSVDIRELPVRFEDIARAAALVERG